MEGEEARERSRMGIDVNDGVMVVRGRMTMAGRNRGGVGEKRMKEALDEL